ncbi:MAG: DoxX family membrane protein [SAR202 cluster bacterium]|nr:DoxX family membrane protein [SAR202 cluster bacterium]
MVALTNPLNNPRWVNSLFSTNEYAWVWLMVRVYIGWDWLHAGWGKITNDAWMNGTSIAGFWTRAVAIPETGRPPISYDWYREFLEFMLDNGWAVWWGPMISIGEFLVGLGLLVGCLTGIAAFFGAVLNWNFMLAGTASTNPILGLLGIGVVIAWKTAGWWGVDRFLLPKVGAPWQPGTLFGGGKLFTLPSSRQEVMRVAEEWARMLIGVGIGLYALIDLTGWLQILILAIGAVVIISTGMGWLFTRRMAKTEQ